MRQGDGSDLLGPGDPRNSDIGMLYVESRDSRQDILTAISTQELQGRKQIAIVLPEQGKAFRQPVDFDGLKNMRRQLKAQLIFIAPSGPGPAEFARQRRFAVYSSLDTFKTALLNEDIPSTNPRVKAQPNPAKRPGILDFGRKGRANKEKESQSRDAAGAKAAATFTGGVPPTPRLPNPTPLVMPPTPPTPFMSEPEGGSAVPPTPFTSEPAGPPAMPPMSPTPSVLNQPGATGAIPPTPRLSGQQTPRIEDQNTVEADQPDVTPRDRRESGGNVAGAAAAGMAAGMFAAGGLENDDDALYAPPAPPRGGAPAPIAQGSATPTGPASGPARPNGEPPAKPPVDNRGAPGIIAFPSATASTPKATGKSKAASGGRGSGKLAAANQDASSANAAAPLARGTNQPSASQPAANAPGANQPGAKVPGANPPGAGPRDKNGGNTGRVAAVGVGAAALGAAAMAGSAGSGTQGSGQPPVNIAAAPSHAATGATGSTPVVRAGGGAAPGGPGMGKRPSGLTPLPPPYSRRQRRIRQRTALLVVLLLLLGALVTAGIFAQRGTFHLPGLPGSLSATVTITPDSKLETDNYVLAALPTGTPDPAHLQIAARLLTQTSGTSTATANATGSISARAASGPLKFFNTNVSSITLSSTTLHSKNGIPVSFNGPITVPASGTLTVTGFAVNTGGSGNIAAGEIGGNCCFSGISVNNPSAFGGGQDAQPNSVIQQSDIDKAAAPLVTTLTQSTGATLQKQIKNSERVVDNTFQCKPTITSSDKAGATAKTTTVQVTETCTEEVYDQAQAQQIATSRLQTKAQNDAALGSQYTLDGQIVTNVLSDTVVSGGGQVTIEVQARGLWVYQFTNQMQQNIKLSLVKLSQAAAQSVLTHDSGVAAAKINISGGTSMPANANDITLVIQQLPGAQATPSGTPGSSGTPGGSNTPGSPTVLPSGTGIPTQPTTPPVPGLGGS